MDTPGFRPLESIARDTARIIRREPAEVAIQKAAAKYGPAVIACLSVLILGFLAFWPSKSKADAKEAKKEARADASAPVTVHVHNHGGSGKVKDKKEDPPAIVAKKEDPPADDKKKEDPPRDDKKED